MVESRDGGPWATPSGGAAAARTPGLAAARTWEVAALVQAVGDALQARFGGVAVRGEIAGFNRAPSGHCYFTLKDSHGQAALRCAMFRRAASLLDFAPAEGQQVELRGRLAVYEARGELQLVVESMRPAGAGALMEQFLRLKARLQAEGLFDQDRKRELPAYPACIGVVTSLAAAALRDVVSTLARRAPHVELRLFPASVQGAQAPAELVAAIAAAGRDDAIELLIVCRGGGSLEDLWAFNDEALVRAIAAAPVPVISGVGHESDITLADLVADVRAATPTAAAELAAPDREDCLSDLQALARRLQLRVRQRLDQQAQHLDRQALRLLRPATALRAHAERLATFRSRWQAALQRRLQAPRSHLDALPGRLQAALGLALAARQRRTELAGARLQGLDPGRVLARGYAWVSDADGRAITQATQVAAGQRLRTTWADGQAESVVERVARGGPLDADGADEATTAGAPAVASRHDAKPE